MINGISNENLTALLIANISPLKSLPYIPSGYALTASPAGTVLPEAVIVAVANSEATQQATEKASQAVAAQQATGLSARLELSV